MAIKVAIVLTDAVDYELLKDIVSDTGAWLFISGNNRANLLGETLENLMDVSIKLQHGLVPKKKMPVIFVIASGSRDRINAVNLFLKTSLEEIKTFATDNMDADFCFGLLRCEKDSVTWLTGDILIEAKDYFYEKIIETEDCSLSLALEELNSSLRRKKMLDGISAYYSPTIVFLLDEKCDFVGLESELSSIFENRWYKRATVIAIGLTETIDKGIMASLTQDVEAVLCISANEEIMETEARCLAENVVHIPITCFLEGKPGAFVVDEMKAELDGQMAIDSQISIIYRINDFDDNWDDDSWE